MIRAAKLSDIDNLVELGAQFINETSYGWTPSAENTRKTLESFIPLSENSDMLAVLTNDASNCVAILEKESLFQVERIGYITKYYLKPDVRGTRLSLELWYACEDYFQDCAEIFAADTSLIPDSAYKNFLIKRGFEAGGAILRRKQNG